MVQIFSYNIMIYALRQDWCNCFKSGRIIAASGVKKNNVHCELIYWTKYEKNAGTVYVTIGKINYLVNFQNGWGGWHFQKKFL